MRCAVARMEGIFLGQPKLKPDTFASTFACPPRPSRQQKSDEKKRSHQKESSLKKIQLATGWMLISYDRLWALGFEPQDLKVLQVMKLEFQMIPPN